MDSIRHNCSPGALHYVQVGFDLLVAHVDVGAVAGWSIAESDAHDREIYRSVAGHISAEQFCSLHLEDAYLDAPDAEIAPGDREHRRKRVYDLVQVYLNYMSATLACRRAVNPVLRFVEGKCMRNAKHLPRRVLSQPETVQHMAYSKIYVWRRHDVGSTDDCKLRIYSEVGSSNQLFMQAIEDSTGREDLVKMLREAVLLSYGKSRGVTRLAKGDSSDRLAARVIALAAKGDGYSLPSTLHFIDSRYVSSLCDAVCMMHGIIPTVKLLFCLLRAGTSTSLFCYKLKLVHCWSWLHIAIYLRARTIN